MAYNALGTALRKAGKPKEAILAFLHVHLLYSTQPDLDAEAVANLEKLFTETHKPRSRPRNAGDPQREVQEQPLGQRREVVMGEESLLAWLVRSLGTPFWSSSSFSASPWWP